MENNPFTYFERDLSWLSFNHRVLTEAQEKGLTLSERINFIAIHSSNMEEFFRIRVAEHYADASNAEQREKRKEAIKTIHYINKEVGRQSRLRHEILENEIIPLLKKEGTTLFKGAEEFEERHVIAAHQRFIEEIFPYLQPVPVIPETLHTFLRDNSLYMVVRMEGNEDNRHWLIELPIQRTPRFISLEEGTDGRFIAFMEDIVKRNLSYIFLNNNIESAYCFKVNRNADITVEDTNIRQLVVQLKSKLKKRKLGAICRLVYDKRMPSDLRNFIANAFHISGRALIPNEGHLNLQDLAHFPITKEASKEKPQPHPHPAIGPEGAVMPVVAKNDVALFYPYHQFSHFIHLLYEAVHDPKCTEIMITQYRVAENSAVINTLIAAAQNGKKVTVFVELKARFDEENNLATAELMKASGINIYFRMPKLKVHAKIALIVRRDRNGRRLKSYGYVGTGNFNEETAKLYSDIGLITCHCGIIKELQQVFAILQKQNIKPRFRHLMVSQYNMTEKLRQLTEHEIENQRKYGNGRIILKMNALQDKEMIDLLYKASTEGVKIDLIVRGICCLKPNQEYSRNISVTRIVDSFLEHSRVWCFGNNGNTELFIGYIPG